MSLEQALADNTAALKEVATLLRESNEGRAAALAAVTQVAGATAAEPKKAKKEKAEAAPSAPTAPTVEQVREAAQKFVSVENEDERAKRKEFMRSLIERFKVKADDNGKKFITYVAEGDRQAVIDAFNSCQPEAEAADEDEIG